MIPCLAIPIYNRKDLLQRCISSIDYPVRHLLVINNGKDSLHDIKIPGFVCEYDEIVNPDNLGCGGAWNQAIHYAIHQWHLDYVLICGNDIQWATGDLAKFEEAFNSNFEADFMSGNWAFSTFALTRSGHEKLGWIDENIWPAYGEDVDFFFRLRTHGGIKQVSVDTHAIHGEAPSWGSMTIHSDPELRRQNHITHEANWRYLEKKWKWNRHDNTAGFTRPFGDNSKSLSSWELQPYRLSQPHFRTHG